LQIETKRQEIGDKRNKQKEEKISSTQDAEHKKRTITIHCLSYANNSQEAWVNGMKMLMWM